MGMLLFDLEERGLLVCGIASTPSISNSQVTTEGSIKYAISI